MFELRGPRLAWFLAVSFILALSGFSLLFSQANPPAAPKKGPANANQSQIGFRPGARANRKHVLAWAGVDVLVNNAGIQRTSPIADITTDVWNDIIAVNLSAPFQTMRHALPWMAQTGYGRVINIASVHGLVASMNKSPYVAAKFGLVGLSRVAALEYAALGSAESGGITVNCICPGWVDTAIIAPQIAERSELLGVSSEEYSIPYLGSKVGAVELPDFMRNLTPLTEVFFTGPVGRSFGQRATALVAPGVSYSNGRGWEFAIEALLPTTRATGSGVGVTAQLVLQLDYLLPGTALGRPIFPVR